MPNYYEMLNIQPTASSAEIEAALDERYNQWLPLVTHHVRRIQLRAEQELQNLEQVRGTLSDPTRRSGYDAGIGIGGPVGGLALADPSALLQSLRAGPGAPLPPPPPGGPAAASARVATGLWVCPTCQAENPPNAKYCFKDGTQLVRLCPECKGETSLIATGMCGNCGYHIDVATRREEIRQLLAALTKQVAEGTLEYAGAVARSKSVSEDVLGWIVVIFSASGVLAGLIAGMGAEAAVVLIFVAAGAALIADGKSFRNRWKTKAMNFGEVLEKSQGQVKRLQAELGSPQLNRN